MSRSRFTAVLALVSMVVVAACSDEEVTGLDEFGPLFSEQESTIAAELVSFMEDLNVALEADEADYRVALAEAITLADSDEAGITVFAKNVGNRRLAFDFVANDPRRAWSGAPGGADDITYAVDQTGDAVPPGGGLTAAQTDAAIVRAMATWDAAPCTLLDFTRNPDFGIDIGVVAFQNGLGGSPFVFADVQHAGWRDINFSGGVLGVTFTFGFIDGSGNFTDANNDRRADAAFREIYYDPSWLWADDGVSNVDVESIAVHEAGHGISHGHFGTIALSNTGSLLAAPRAVMNALYAAPFRSLAGTDLSGHCNDWGSWPIE